MKSRAIRSTLIPLLALALSATAYAHGGEVNNGGGSAEHNFAVAYLNLERFVLNCTASSACDINDTERGTLAAISNSMDDERRTSDQLQFIAGHATTPNAFDDNGTVRVAKTGSDVGSVVLLNLDLIYPVDANGRVRAMTVPEAVAILIHEFGHHHGVSNHQALDLLGAKVGSVTEQNVKQVWLYDSRISLTVINYQVPMPPVGGVSVPDFMVFGLPSVIVGGHEFVNGNDQEKYVDISAELSSKLTCPAPGLKLVGFDLRDLRWKRGRVSGGGDIQTLARACILKRCEGPHDPTSVHDKDQTVELDMRFYYPAAPEDGYLGMSYRRGSMQVTPVVDWLPCPHDD
jgi:hypothetical protein